MADASQTAIRLARENIRDRFVRALRGEAGAWAGNEGVALTFTLKALLASAIALWLGFRLDLENPRWSVVSIFIVMQPEAGLVLEKGFYRILATLAGCVVSVAMVGAFAQYRELFLGVLALWLGVCVACSLRFRNYQAYAWALLGYTVTIVGLPAAYGNPDGVFAAAVARATEIGIGVACAGVVGALVFPRTSTARLRVRTRERFTEFMPYALSVFARADGPEIDAEAQNRMMEALASQDAAMSAAAFENPHHPDFVVRVRRLNRSFLRLSTRIHLLLHLRRRLRAGGDAALNAALDAQAVSLAETARTAGDPVALRDALRGARSRLFPDPSVTGAAAADLVAHTTLVSEFLDDAASHADAFSKLEEPLEAGDAGEPPYVTTRVDGVLAAITGARATLTVALLSVFWIATEWPDGVFAIMCGMIAYALCAASPRPVAMMGEAGFAFLLAIPAGFVFRFVLMPVAHDFQNLFLAIAPFLAFSAYLIARPRRFLVGLFFSVWFLTLAGPENNPEPDLAVFCGQSFAGLVGIGTGMALFALLMPNGSRWVRRRERRELRDLVIRVCEDGSPGFGAAFEHDMRALLRRIAGNRSAGAGDGEADRVVRWSYASLEIGGAMTGFREAVAGADATPEMSSAALRVRAAIADVFREPSAGALRAAVRATHESDGALPPSALSYLHLMRIALLDPDSPLAEISDSLPKNTEVSRA